MVFIQAKTDIASVPIKITALSLQLHGPQAKSVAFGIGYLGTIAAFTFLDGHRWQEDLHTLCFQLTYGGTQLVTQVEVNHGYRH